ncbi:MAG: right-handed parallel beta-helix repeat-containing protein [Candidatus Hydrogenedentes bacterium]|nr:right-handed parallel beta-helix repeat-containing protein [Candidatus Hydrogenedentota bacterium]
MKMMACGFGHAWEEILRFAQNDPERGRQGQQGLKGPRGQAKTTLGAVAGRLPVLAIFLIVHGALAEAPVGALSVSGHSSLQAAIDANPGKVLYVPAGDYILEAPVRISSDQGGLWGPGRLIQSKPDQNIVEIANARGVRIHDLTLMRAEGSQDSTAHALYATQCRDLEVAGLQVIDNRSQAGTIYLDHCRESVVRDCLVRNYQRVGVDDRTSSPLYGYAFRVIDGTGIQVTFSSGIQILDNRVIEDNLYPDEATKTKYELGKLTEGKQPRTKGTIGQPGGDYVNNWHQGSAITVSSPEDTNHVAIVGNYIENAAQGIDMHTDNSICSRNVIHYAFVGLKCMHGAKNVIISDNIVTHNDLWGLVMLPGVLSHPTEAASEGKEAHTANFTRGNIIANNIFSDYGLGHESYNWAAQRAGVISLESGQLPENPIMTDVIIEGNIVYDTAREQILEEGMPKDVPPRYDWAVYITPDLRPQGLIFRDNIFHPGTEGVSNIALEGEE